MPEAYNAFKHYRIKVYDMVAHGKRGAKPMDVEAIRKELGVLFIESIPYGDATQTQLVAVPRNNKDIEEAVRRVKALGYETDED